MGKVHAARLIRRILLVGQHVANIRDLRNVAIMEGRLSFHIEIHLLVGAHQILPCPLHVFDTASIMSTLSQ